MIKSKLNKSRSYESSNKNTTLKVSLSNDNKEVSLDKYTDTVNQYSIYLDEREACNKIRLTAQINLIASNVLFNQVTEIVKNEDSSECICLNFTPQKTFNNYGKDEQFIWGEDINDCIRDTQITSSKIDTKNYKYHPGIDIFNNHILRSRNFTPMHYSSTDTSINADFNTINDFIRDINGRKRVSKAYSKHGFNSKAYLHLYQKDDIYTFKEALNHLLLEKNGWLGFLNKSKMPVFDSDGNNLNISRTLNNEQINKFIDMYPGKDCYDLLPYFNKTRNRKEKNWEYCLCYPYSSTTEGISCINSKLGALNIAFIDENEDSDDDLRRTVIYSAAKHGLNADDTINIYRSRQDNSQSELVEKDVNVDSIIDDYTFAVYLSDAICKNWVSVFDQRGINNNFKYFDKAEGIYSVLDDVEKAEASGLVAYSFNSYVNADFDTEDEIGSHNLSFTKVENHEECQYYVRIFSRMPNFDFMEGDVNEETIYQPYLDDDRNAVDKFADIEYNHQCILSKLSYAKNIYNDNIYQMVFNDDICFDYIKDNLNRPLSSIYLSFFKTNYGHKEWYNGEVTNASVEHSHCFGKVNCGIELSPYIRQKKFMKGNARTMNNVLDGYSGLSQLLFRESLTTCDDDEINFNNQNLFYGDLCEYSPGNCYEKVLQPIMHRFNTQQRELENSGLKMADKFNKIVYDEIIYDDFDFVSDFETITSVFDENPTAKKEGYLYQSSYEIPIRAWSGQIKEFTPTSYEIATINKNMNGYVIATCEDNFFNKNFKLYLYNKYTYKSYACSIKNILSSNKFMCYIIDDNGEYVDLSVDGIIDTNLYILYKGSDTIPSYANIANDGSGIYKWRYLYQNGFEDTDNLIEEYPFTNNCLYINKQINIFIKRQDPFGNVGLVSSVEPTFGITSLTGVKSDIYDENGNSTSITKDENDASC